MDVADEIGAPVSRSYNGEICFCGARGSFKEHLLVSKALPIFLAPRIDWYGDTQDKDRLSRGDGH